MNLIDIYIQEVTRRLPEKTRDDIAMELRSTIEDMLPENYSEEEVKIALSKLGDPAALADQYRGSPNYLIGPGFYEPYICCIKLVLPFALTISLIIFFFDQFMSWSGEGIVWSFIGSFIGEMVLTILNVGMQVFFWITLVFLIVERSGVSPSTMRTTGEKWKPENLNEIPYIPRKKAIPRAEAVGSLIWTVIWTVVYFNADHLIGAYKKINGGDGHELVAPVFNQDVLLSYWPVIIIFIAVELALAIYKWFARKWTNQLAIVNTVYNVFSVILTIVILKNPDILDPAFMTYMIELFNETSASLEQVLIWIRDAWIAITIIAVGISVFDGFRKAMIKDLPMGYPKKELKL